VGQAEFDLIRASGFRAFPPRSTQQPFFYPVTKEDYAIRIACNWNPKDPNSGLVGYVLRVRANSTFLDTYEVHTVGDSRHQEYWIPAADIEEFNSNIVGLIEIISEYRKQ